MIFFHRVFLTIFSSIRNFPKKNWNLFPELSYQCERRSEAVEKAAKFVANKDRKSSEGIRINLAFEFCFLSRKIIGQFPIWSKTQIREKEEGENSDDWKLLKINKKRRKFEIQMLIFCILLWVPPAVASLLSFVFFSHDFLHSLMISIHLFWLDVVILDDKFGSIVKAIIWGRTVYDNIRMFLQFQLTVNVVALLLVFIGAVAGFGQPLNAVMMLWVSTMLNDK